MKNRSPTWIHVSLPCIFLICNWVQFSGDVEIKLLKARLEQTEAALERIVAHMGSVTDRLARNGVMMGDTKVEYYNIGRLEEL